MRNIPTQNDGPSSQEQRYNRIISKMQITNKASKDIKLQPVVNIQSRRKHNSPDMTKFNLTEGNSQRSETSPKINRRKIQQIAAESPIQQYQDRKMSMKSYYLPQKMSLELMQGPVPLQQSQGYIELHSKLDDIESKIEDMKQHVQRKREQRTRLQQARKLKKQQRQQDCKNNQNNQVLKIDLRQLVTKVPEQTQLRNLQMDPYQPAHHVYYVSEIIKSYRKQKTLAREHLLTSLHIFRVLENTKFATDQQMKQRRISLPRRKGYENSKTIVFDLDQTLIHCNDTLNAPNDVRLPVTFSTGQVIEAGINIRPYAIEILKNLSQNFQIIVFTASHSCYANVVLDYLDPQGQWVHHRLFRQHCHQTPQGMYVKDLRVIDRDLSQILLVDNAAYSYSPQIDNGIPILPYYQGKKDYQLKALQNYLQGMLLVNDVRQINRQTFMLHLYPNYLGQPQRLVEQLYFNQQGA